MPLHTEQFFTEQLVLTGGAVIGDTYYAHPVPDSPLRLLIDFASTIRSGEYDGLRLRIQHADRGILDTTILTFADHDTFRSRDDAIGRRPGRDGHAVIRDWHTSGEPPWQGADTTQLRQAIDQYTTFWLPETAEPQPTTTAPHPVLTRGEKAHGFWLTDPEFRARLEHATTLLLDTVADRLDDDFSLLQALDGAWRHAGRLFGVPMADEFGALAEAKAAAEIVGRRTRSPFAPAVARDLVLLDQRPIDEQRQAVQAARRRSASAVRSVRGIPAAVPSAAPSTTTSRTR
ncbi:hypothetical protein ACWEL8_09465 [Streptomyces sp. NPDC004690]